ncbi:MAG TPA: tRNA lysidine(34) synthetase TilS, partial [Baekduia sp.]|nr:tRNA lysidine(34) synthetase TilS [Baekduia sp.]
MAPRLSETLLDRVRATRTIEPGARLVVMLSGGRDSACLTKLAVDLSAEVTALHVNHGLRGAESAVDEAHCRELCAGLGVGLVVEHAGPAAPGNTHAWARDVRYDAGVALAQRNDAALAVAHTETDQLETILYRLATSPGRRALLGMAVRRGRIVRPLLAARVTRAETEAFCRENGLSWRDDASNLDPSYARTRVREQ